MAGVSASWYTYLEQARRIRVSTQVIDSIARALSLTAEEHRYIELLATGKTGHRVLGAPPDVRHAVNDLVRAVTGVPVYVADRRGDLFAWNTDATEWFTDFALLPEKQRNMLWWMLADPVARERFVDWESDARDLLGRFRTATAMISHDERAAEVTSEILNIGPWVQQWWEQHDARPMTPRLRRLRHPVLGERVMRLVTSYLAGSEDVGLVFHVPAGTRAASDEASGA